MTFIHDMMVLTMVALILNVMWVICIYTMVGMNYLQVPTDVLCNLKALHGINDNHLPSPNTHSTTSYVH